MEAKERIILALDVDTAEKAIAAGKLLKDHVGAFKIGMELYNACGPSIVEEFQRMGANVFVDLKFHDIPNTVASASRIMTRLGAWMFNVHASGGQEMMKSAVAAAAEEAASLGRKKPLMLAVTVLTSMNLQQLREDVGIPAESVEDVVVRWAKMAQACGMDGVVCSPKEAAALRKACGEDFLLVTPGIRPAWAAANDQKRITTPKDAVQLGSSYMVIGRPIVKADDPVEAAKRIIRELEEIESC